MQRACAELKCELYQFFVFCSVCGWVGVGVNKERKNLCNIISIDLSLGFLEIL